MGNISKILFMVLTLILVFNTVFYSNDGNGLININRVAYAEEGKGGGDREFSYDLCTSGGWDGQEPRSAFKLSNANTENVETVWNGLVEGGFSDEQAAGIMGNIAHESQFDPSIIEKQGYGGFGLVQWTGGRRTNIENYAKENGKDVNDINFQVEYLFHELDKSYKAVYNEIKESKTIDEALLIFQNKFEIPAQKTAGTACRGAFAYEVYDKYSGSGPASSGGEESGGDTTEESSEGNNGRGEITGSLEYDPFVKNKPVQNTTGIKTGDEGTISSSESFVVGQWVYILLDIIMIGILVLLALYMLLLGVVVLIISFFNPLVANNGIVRFLLGEKMLERLASEGVKGIVGMLFMRFFIGILLMMFAVTGYVNNVQVIILEFFINLLR